MTTQISPIRGETQSQTTDLDQYPGTRIQPAPSSPVRMSKPTFDVLQPSSAMIENSSTNVKKGPGSVTRKPVGSTPRPTAGSRQSSIRTVDDDQPTKSDWPLPREPLQPRRESHGRAVSKNLHYTSPPKLFTSQHGDPEGVFSAEIETQEQEVEEVEQLQYHHTFESRVKRKDVPTSEHARVTSVASDSQTTSSDGLGTPVSGKRSTTMSALDISGRVSSMTLGSELHRRGRSLTPIDLRSDSSLSPNRGSRAISAGRSPDSGNRVSTVDLLNIPYAQQMAHQSLTVDHANLLGAVGKNASLLDIRKTLEMYRANVKKTNDPAIQYEFAVFMVQAAQDLPPTSSPNGKPSNTSESGSNDRSQLLTEARHILQKLADRTNVYAQYYLADGFFSGLFNKDKPDYDRAFPLFVSAGKHGHAEAGYRAALCYEFGWGCRKDYAKAVQFYRQSASKNHPGAATRLGLACLQGDMGLVGKYREGVKWLKRATESADMQHNSAPYELGLMHINGFGDDVFKDEGYAAQLLTQAAELGHAEANLRMGEAYEHGLLTCPKDPALSIHFYTGAAQAGIPKAMMALCAWYMVGAEPVLAKDEAEAYEWARKSAESGYAKAAYAVGYFTEMGIGCRRDPLEANVWYVRAADEGEERAKQRLAIIRAAEMAEIPGGTQTTTTKGTDKKKGVGKWLAGKGN